MSCYNFLVQLTSQYLNNCIFIHILRGFSEYILQLVSARIGKAVSVDNYCCHEFDCHLVLHVCNEVKSKYQNLYCKDLPNTKTFKDLLLMFL